MRKLPAKLMEEFEALVPPTVFFFVALHVVALVRSLMLEGIGIPVGTTASVTVAALIIAKAVLVADLMPFINLYPHKPLVYNVAWKTVIYFLVASFVHYLERLFHVWRETGGFVVANEKLLAGIVWPHFWAIQILLAVLILMYCTTREFVRAIGRDRARELFFGPQRGA